VWVYLGPGPNGTFYGLPDPGRSALKVGRHETEGRDDDPEDAPGPDPAALAAVEDLLADQLAVPVAERVHAETCLYTSTATEDFLLDALPGEPRVLVGSACSGHGFKFGPFTGRLLATWALEGRSAVPELEEAGERVRLPGA
jgi:sarcosine oxidase